MISDKDLKRSLLLEKKALNDSLRKMRLEVKQLAEQIKGALEKNEKKELRSAKKLMQDEVRQYFSQKKDIIAKIKTIPKQQRRTKKVKISEGVQKLTQIFDKKQTQSKEQSVNKLKENKMISRVSEGSQKLAQIFDKKQAQSKVQSVNKLQENKMISRINEGTVKLAKIFNKQNKDVMDRLAFNEKSRKMQKLNSTQQNALKFTKMLKYKYNKGEKYAVFKLVSKEKGKEIMYYTVPMDWVLDKNGRFVDQIVYDKMKMFIQNPVMFKEYANKDVRENVFQEFSLLNDFHASDDYDGYEVDDIGGFIGDEYEDYDVDYEDGDVGLDIQYFAKAQCHSQFIQINEEYEEGCCFYNSMRHYGHDNAELKKVTKMEDILSYLNKNRLNYRIVQDSLEWITKDYVRNDDNLCVKTKITQSGGDNVYREIKQQIMIYKQKKFDEGKIYLLAIRLQKEYNHIYVPKGKNIFTNNARSQVYFFDRENNNKKVDLLRLEKRPQDERMIYYDVETIEDPKNNLFFRPVSVSITYFDQKHGEKKIQQYTEEELIPILQQNCRFYIDEQIDLENILQEFMLKDGYNNIMSFNGSKFDNLFLLRSFSRNKHVVEVSLQGGMLELKNSPCQQQYLFKTMDLRRFLGPGSLEFHSGCYIKNPMFRKKKIDIFDELQDRYNQGILKRQDEFLQRLKEYNDLDVISLGLIHRSFMRQLGSVLDQEYPGQELCEQIYRSVSTPHFFYKIFTKSIQKQDHKPRKITLTKFQDDKKKRSDENTKKLELGYTLLSMYKTGGRCDCNKTIVFADQKTADENKELIGNNNIVIDEDGGRIYSEDVCSLYPFVMMAWNEAQYMSGDMMYTKEFKENYLGVYFGYVTQTKKDDEMLFYCDKDGSGLSNDFNSQRRIKAVFTTHEIKYFRQERPHWKFEIEFGLYSKKSIRGVDLFKCLVPFVREKSKQDYLKQTNDPAYNKSLRELCKTLCNSLSGKFLQSAKKTVYYFDEHYTIRSKQLDMDEFKKSLLKSDKMLHIGAYIYSLSKLYMYKYQYGKYQRSQFIYTDTDSNKKTEKMMKQWREDFGHIRMKDIVFPECLEMDIGYTDETTLSYTGGDSVKCLGQFEDEYGDYNYKIGYFASKKEYFVSDGKNYKCSLKGLDQNNFLLLSPDNNDMYKGDSKIDQINIAIYHGYRKITAQAYNDLKPSEQQKCKIFVDIKQDLLSTATEDVQQMFKNRRELTDICKNNPWKKQQLEQIFKNKFLGKPSFVLTSQFKRDMMTQSVQKVYMLKQISCEE